jgi:hypothetical protein
VKKARSSMRWRIVQQRRYAIAAMSDLRTQSRRECERCAFSSRSVRRPAARLRWFATSSRGSESRPAVIARDNADRRISSQKSRTGVSHCPNYLGRREALYRLDKQAAGCVKARVFIWLQIPLWRVGRHDLREVGRQPSKRRRLCASLIFAQRGSPWPRN